MKKTSKRTGASRRHSRARPKRKSRPATGPAAQPAPLAALAAFDDVARAERMRWYVFGAQAVAAYGVPRFTADIDITIDVADRPLGDFVRALRRGGFEPRFDDERFIAETRVCPVTHLETEWHLDLVLAGPGLEQRFFDNARQLRIAKRRFPVIAPEDLVAIKILAGRPKDLEDVRGLLRIAELDDAAIRATIGELESVLDQNDLLSTYVRLLREQR